MQEAQVKFQAAQQKMAQFQAEFQKSAQEFQAWQTLVNLETAKEQQESGIAQRPAMPANGNQPSLEGTNKTDMVRELLRQHPAGMSPADIWKEMEPHMKTRAYLYSVLKRLKDKGDARERRGKYFLNPKIEDNQGIAIA